MRRRGAFLGVAVALALSLGTATRVAAGNNAVVDEAAINALVPKLKKAGATGILVLPIERMVP